MDPVSNEVSYPGVGVSAQDEFAGEIIVNVPPTSEQNQLALGALAALLVGLAAAAPFAATPLAQAVDFVPFLNGALTVTNLITAILVLGHFSVYRSPALLALASGYLFSALIVIPHALTFPGAFSPTGLLSAGAETAAWLYIFWHFGFPSFLLIYVWLKDKELIAQGALGFAIWRSVVFTILLVAGIALLTIFGEPFLPRVYNDAIHRTPFGNHVLAVQVLYCATALVLLWRYRRSALDLWLMVVVCAFIGELTLSGDRFSLGFYLSRGFSLVTSSFVLAILLVQTTSLYAHVINSNVMLRRERNNKLMKLEAMSVAIAHEVRQPLAAIVMNSEAALHSLDRSGSNSAALQEARSALADIIDDSHRTSDVFNNIRELFVKTGQETKPVDLNEIILRVLHILRAELKRDEIVIKPDLSPEIPVVMGQDGQLQEVVINLVHNAAEAMTAINNRPRVLKIGTQLQANDNISVSVEDSGPGIDPNKIDSIFDAFISTKDSGIGLGLAICRMIIERHGGRISASAGTEGGARFEFVLPIKAATATSTERGSHAEAA